MIHESCLLAGVGIAEHFAEKGLIVGSLPGTVINELDKMSSSAILEQFSIAMPPINLGDEADAYRNYASIASNSLSGNLDNPSLHDNLQDDVIELISKAVLKHIGFAKNVVKPVIVDYVDQVKEQLQNAVAPSATSQFNVDVMDIPDILQSNELLDLLKPYQNKPAALKASPMALGEKTGEELLALMQWGDSSADTAITAWYTRKGNDWMQTVWNTFYRPTGSIQSTPTLTIEAVLALNPFDRADVGTALYLWGRRLYDEVDTGASGMNLQQYQAQVAEIRDFGGCLIDESLRRIAFYNTSETLVIDTQASGISFADRRKQIRVYGPVYYNWLQAGGSPELLFGLLLTGRKVFTKASINELIPELQQRWHTFVLFHNAAESNRSFDLFKQILATQFEISLDDLMEGEKLFISQTPQYYDTVRSKFKDQLQALTPTAMSSLDHAAMVLLCRSRFYYTQAECILTDIQRAAEVNPDIDVREAALLATINYVSDYVADQLTLLKE